MAYLEKSSLRFLGLSDQHNVGMHDTQQMSLATGVSEGSLFMEKASSAHKDKDAQDLRANCLETGHQHLEVPDLFYRVVSH